MFPSMRRRTVSSLPAKRGRRVRQPRVVAFHRFVRRGMRPSFAYSSPSPADESMEGKDRKSTRLNSSHVATSYAVFCLKKKNKTEARQSLTHEYLASDLPHEPEGVDAVSHGALLLGLCSVTFVTLCVIFPPTLFVNAIR